MFQKIRKAALVYILQDSSMPILTEAASAVNLQNAYAVCAEVVNSVALYKCIVGKKYFNKHSCHCGYSDTTANLADRPLKGNCNVHF